MIVLVKPQLAALTQRGRLDVWSPRSGSAPALGRVHEVRARRDGEAVTWARKLETRDGVLQELTFAEAMAAGFKTRDDFYGWFRKKFNTGPLMNEPVLTTVVTFELVAEEPVEYLHQRSEFGYTRSPMSGLDGEWTVPKAVRQQFAEEARTADVDRESQRRANWELLTLGERVAELESRRHFADTDISRELRLADHALRRAWEKLGRDERAA